ncbi:MAG: hypothetical protein AAFU64_11575 [Bacteroidota bacterium]
MIQIMLSTRALARQKEIGLEVKEPKKDHLKKELLKKTVRLKARRFLDKQ